MSGPARSRAGPQPGRARQFQTKVRRAFPLTEPPEPFSTRRRRRTCRRARERESLGAPDFTVSRKSSPRSLRFRPSPVICWAASSLQARFQLKTTSPHQNLARSAAGLGVLISWALRLCVCEDLNFGVRAQQASSTSIIAFEPLGLVFTGQAVGNARQNPCALTIHLTAAFRGFRASLGGAV